VLVAYAYAQRPWLRRDLLAYFASGSIFGMHSYPPPDESGLCLPFSWRLGISIQLKT